MLVLSTVEHNYLVVDVYYLLHKYQLHVSALMAIFRLNELTKNIGSYIWHASYIRWRGGLLDLVCIECIWRGLYGFCCANLSIIQFRSMILGTMCICIHQFIVIDIQWVVFVQISGNYSQVKSRSVHNTLLLQFQWEH